MKEVNFDTYEIMRLAEMPKVETVIVPTYDFWGGVGELTISVVAPAVLNAIFAATGKPVRSLPLKNLKFVSGVHFTPGSNKQHQQAPLCEQIARRSEHVF